MTSAFSPGQVAQLRRKLAAHTHHFLCALLGLPLRRSQALRRFPQADALPATTLLLARSLVRAGEQPRILRTPTGLFWIEVQPFHLILCPPPLHAEQFQVDFQQVSPLVFTPLLDVQAFTPGDLTFDYPDWVLDEPALRQAMTQAPARPPRLRPIEPATAPIFGMQPPVSPYAGGYPPCRLIIPLTGAATARPRAPGSTPRPKAAARS
ncbi:hypothetical protein DGo_PB0145 (plasmid) [Deinococcus gobiensis I-0]|uniref:Uncharacterized protein n=1 Tax=Deinococcus gobiensis (strain DSM 21396 / JCM 16679 / CGMCC 1.7299 / I-0) TaxID=745776 RepID=H8H1L7_DEIGI|nr:hypothetical protein DGo_PB0145 [Deinococcus gobiensis I-0]